MKMFKNLLAVVPLLVIGLQAQAFSDITVDDWPYMATTYLEKIEVFKGYEDGSFGRDRLINRAESLKTILVAAELDTPEASVVKFKDVPTDVWFAKFVNHAADLGIVSGDGSTGDFVPARSVNKAEFLKMLMLAFDIDPTTYDLEASPNDVPNDAWFAPFMKFAAQFEIAPVDGDGNSHPGKELTRAECAQLIFNMMHKGKGLSPQVLLTLSEAHLIKGVEFVEKNEVGVAAILVTTAEKYTSYALELLPENAVVQSAIKIVSALKNIVGAYAAGADGRSEDVIAASKQAWTDADDSFKLNANNQALSDKIKNISAQVADKARTELGQ